ncbi:MAG TPA: ATP-dependent helicase [Anaerolineales bacterium]|nr:ATP-dependent helicase [Anaerolineales bacterium]
MTTSFTPRPSQENILRYDGGRLGIAAVPGAGKTHILSALAAQIIQSGALEDGQEVLIVTLVNSAVNNFENRIKSFFDNTIQPLFKYRVRTLHGLAHDIVREKPARVGLEERFSIIDEREAGFIRRESVNAWLASHSLDDYLNASLDASKRDWVKRDQLPNLLDSLANAFIRSSKDRLLTLESLRAKLDQSPAPLPLAELGYSIYADYQRALAYRGAVDFDDLIRLALTLLESDEEFRVRLNFRYKYILEDEAQDSSMTQQRILELISSGDDNWVRVGDPNQAIFETFTTASPEFLREFIQENPSIDMPESGRSQPSVLDVANHLIDWTMQEHPEPEARNALSVPHIIPVPEGDPQQNPTNDLDGIKFISNRYTPDEEMEAVVKSIKSYLDSVVDFPIEEQPTIAVLVPRNARGVEVVNTLRGRGIEPIELISSTSETRAAAGSLNMLLLYLSDPQSARKLANAFRVYRRDVFGSNRNEAKDISEEELEARPFIEQIPTLLRKMVDVEDFIAPQNANDWLTALGESEAAQVIQELGGFRVYVQRWLNAVTLPIDQLVLTLAQDVFTDPSDLALAHKLALVLRKVADDHPDWRLPELTSELGVIAKNQRRFIGFSSDDSGFDPERHRGRVVVTTMHKAKGLEWDRVYLMSVNNYDFPSNMPNDPFISERWFVRSGLNLEAEALAQLTALESTSESDWYEEGTATLRSRLDYVKERLRLFYVGITRAKRELIVTWNSGRQGDAMPSLALSELMGWWEGK